MPKHFSKSNSGVHGSFWHSPQRHCSFYGSSIAFTSSASDLSVATDTNAKSDVFVRNVTTNKTTLISQVAGTASNGTSSNVVISGDGQTVAFISTATNLSTRDAAVKGSDAGEVLVPGKPEESLLIQRAADGSMPPEKDGRRLTKEEIDVLLRWIADGAKWEEK